MTGSALQELCAEAPLMRLAPADDLAGELWRRMQTKREVTLSGESSEFDRALVALVMSLARLSAQRDARGHQPTTETEECS